MDKDNKSLKILFIYPNLGGPIGFNIGISILSSILKSKSHKVKLIHLNEAVGFSLDKDRIKQKIIEYNPNIIGISVNSNQFPIGIEIAKFIKKDIDKKIPILFGGIHPTMNAEQTLNYDCVDMVIVGEGEESILELIEKFQRKEDISQIKNLWLKKDGKIIKNRLRGFISLSEVPFMDVSIYDFQKIIDSRNGWIDVILSRGCPFNCTYCFNKPYKDIYSEYCGTDEIKRYVRRGDYTKTINGIKEILKKYKNIKCISFVDDNFLMDSNIIEFIKSFKKEINLPFVINSHVLSINDRILKELKEGGCDLIRVGLECGNEKIRKKILNRNVKYKTIIEKVKLIRRYGIRAFTYNMIGLPTEKRKDIIKTLKMNVECSPDVVKVSTFYPYEGTKIYSICIDFGLISKESDKSRLTYYDKTILNFDNDFVLFIQKIQRYFDCYLNYYNNELSSIYEPLIDEIESLSREEWNEEEKHIKIKEKIDTISKDLSSKSIIYYAMRFTSYFAVKVQKRNLKALTR